MKKTTTPSLTDQLKGSLEDIREDSMRSLPIERTVPSARAFSAEEVRAARDSLNMTQSEFAELLQVATKTVQAWEGGRRSPSIGQARWIEMFTSKDWSARLRKAEPHSRAPHKTKAVVVIMEDIEQVGPRRRSGGRTKKAESPTRKRTVASAGRQQPPEARERLKKPSEG